MFSMIRSKDITDRDLVRFLEEDVGGARDPLEDGVNMRAHQRDKEGWTPLHWAASEGWDGFARKLLSMKASTNVTDPCGTTPLMVAAYNGHVSVLEAILRDPRTEVLQENAFGSTAMHYAAQQGHAGCIAPLCRASCEVNSGDKHGETPISWAARNGHSDAVVALCDCNADPLQLNFASEDAIEMARNAGHDEIVEILEAETRFGEAADALPAEASTVLPSNEARPGV